MRPRIFIVLMLLGAIACNRSFRNSSNPPALRFRGARWVRFYICNIDSCRRRDGADLAGCENIQAAHLAEALQYRSKIL